MLTPVTEERSQLTYYVLRNNLKTSLYRNLYSQKQMRFCANIVFVQVKTLRFSIGYTAIKTLLESRRLLVPD